MDMPKKTYHNLDALLAADPKAQALFQRLPQYAQDQIRQRGENVNSYDSLSDYADNLLRGDG